MQTLEINPEFQNNVRRIWAVRKKYYGVITLNNKVITKKDLIKFLSFERIENGFDALQK